MWLNPNRGVALVLGTSRLPCGLLEHRVLALESLDHDWPAGSEGCWLEGLPWEGRLERLA